MIKRNISFDFDGVFHKNVDYDIMSDSYINTTATDKCTPNFLIFDIIKNKSAFFNVIIVTARGPNSYDDIVGFLKKHNMTQYINGIIFTDGKYKSSFLKNYNAIEHYDDSPQVVKEIDQNSNVVTYHINPKKYKLQTAKVAFKDILKHHAQMPAVSLKYNILVGYSDQTEYEKMVMFLKKYNVNKYIIGFYYVWKF